MPSSATVGARDSSPRTVRSSGFVYPVSTAPPSSPSYWTLVDIYHGSLCAHTWRSACSPEYVKGGFSELRLYGGIRSSQGRLNHLIHRCVQIRVCVVWRGSPTK